MPIAMLYGAAVISAANLSHKSIGLDIEIIQLQITFFEILQIIRVPQERDQSIFGRHVCPGAISAYITLTLADHSCAVFIRGFRLGIWCLFSEACCNSKGYWIHGYKKRIYF